MPPMAPSKREKMTARLAARRDAPDDGKLIVDEFPEEKLVYGLFKIDARIHENTEISQQISLWNQRAAATRGNSPAVPIETSILYVSRLDLRAESGRSPNSSG